VITETQHHWDIVYGRRAANELIWFEGSPSRSLNLITAMSLDPGSPVFDVGGGASTLVDELLARAFTELTVLDVPEKVLAKVGARLGEQRRFVTLMQKDVTTFQPARQCALWPRHVSIRCADSRCGGWLQF
jgi:16S rRNA A1518/A1519 N6-dimethyltransferase RsmA/KsgA/DIM1 with predicted DNA glycosylase/AP lyase activity